MIQLNPKICELFEVAMHHEQESNYVKLLTDFAMKIMQWTNGFYQINHHKWSDSKIQMYVSRTSKYAHIMQAFSTIREHSPSPSLINTAIKDSNFLYNEINLEYSQEWNTATQERRTEILENILMPHMLFIRFLEKYQKENSF